MAHDLNFDENSLIMKTFEMLWPQLDAHGNRGLWIKEKRTPLVSWLQARLAFKAGLANVLQLQAG